MYEHANFFLQPSFQELVCRHLVTSSLISGVAYKPHRCLHAFVVCYRPAYGSFLGGRLDVRPNSSSYNRKHAISSHTLRPEYIESRHSLGCRIFAGREPVICPTVLSNFVHCSAAHKFLCVVGDTLTLFVTMDCRYWLRFYPGA